MADDPKWWPAEITEIENHKTNGSWTPMAIRGVAAPNGYFVSKQEDDVAGGAAFGSWVDMMIALSGECH